MRPRRLRALIACAFPAAITLGALAGAVAKADPADDYTIANAGRVCATLDLHPDFNGVTGVMAAVIDDSGLSVEDAAEVVVNSVRVICPHHEALIIAYGNAGQRRI